MNDEGLQLTSEEHVDGQQQPEKVARERSGTVQGVGAEIVAKYVTGKQVAITETIDNKQKKKKLYVASIQTNSETKKTEYQLTEKAGDTTDPYKDGKWYPEVKVHVAK
ncbi:hypothetical protein AG0111_0g12960 [Alternaria gaisen]|uniref:Uncharacterized protein n=1 Tax=Alternaria gaisen TaxID=167740 RepID=A0ACB6F308_9PLEO|nr:hypothetical protein AG0111_0g12960 [Alternaria gaisen]